MSDRTVRSLDLTEEEENNIAVFKFLCVNELKQRDEELSSLD